MNQRLFCQIKPKSNIQKARDYSFVVQLSSSALLSQPFFDLLAKNPFNFAIPIWRLNRRCRTKKLSGENAIDGSEESKIHLWRPINGGYGFGGYGNGMMSAGYGGAGMYSYGMAMPFVHFGSDEYILFDFWHPFAPLGMAMSCLFVLVIAAGFEAIRWFRHICGRRAELVMPSDQTHNNGTLSSGNNPMMLAFGNVKVRFRAAAVDVLLYGVQLLISYALMIIVMTLNGWLILSVVIGQIVAKLLLRLITLDSMPQGNN
uniref:Copper transport protein n=1 Tax=Globodera rostochiensis TaxID=31243 RepID=A0A914I7H9_GLORO